MNAENENGTRQGAALKTDYDATNVTEASLKVNGIGAPPPGHAWENGKLVPVELPQSFSPEEKEQLSVIIPVMRWVGFSRAKLAALEFLGGLDTRPVAEVAKSFRLSPSVVHRQVRALRRFILEVRK